MSTRRRPGSRVVGAIALAAVASACAPGSSGDAGETTTSASTVVVAEVSTSLAPDFTSAEAVESEPSLPPDTQPQDVAEPSTGTEKDVVTRAAGVDGAGVLPEGVASVTAQVTSVEGEVCEVCLWLADDDVSRRRGLMGVTDLGDTVGMAFRWEQPRTGNFFMFQTPTPLSIAWFDMAGSHVGQADMEPCLVEDSAVCERYTADSPYVLAVEMFGGQLDAIGIGPGASIELLDLPCV